MTGWRDVPGRPRPVVVTTQLFSPPPAQQCFIVTTDPVMLCGGKSDINTPGTFQAIHLSSSTFFKVSAEGNDKQWKMDYNGKWILLWKRYNAAMQVLIKILCMIFLNFLYRPCQTHNTTVLPRESTKQPRDSLDPGLQEWYCLPCRQPPNPLPGTWKFRVFARSNFSLATIPSSQTELFFILLANADHAWVAYQQNMFVLWDNFSVVFISTRRMKFVLWTI